jgi:hypothetical protein
MNGNTEMVKPPHVRPEAVREREYRIEQVKFHRAHVIELVYFAIVGTVALGAISFFLDPQWAWFLRGIICGLALTLVYAWARMIHQRTL